MIEFFLVEDYVPLGFLGVSESDAFGLDPFNPVNSKMDQFLPGAKVITVASNSI